MLGGDAVALRLGEVLQAFPLRQVLADEAAGVRVGAALPGVVGRREVEAHAVARLPLSVAPQPWRYPGSVPFQRSGR